MVRIFMDQMLPRSSMYVLKILNSILSVSAAKVMIFRGGSESTFTRPQFERCAGWLTFAPMCKYVEMKINLPLYLCTGKCM